MGTPLPHSCLRSVIAILLTGSFTASVRAQDAAATDQTDAATADSTRRSIEMLPIVLYDTDIGFGGGAKAKWVERTSSPMSFDLTLFASTKGERWVRGEYSWPDAQLRQGTLYPVAVDALVDYDRLNRASYFGVGNGARYDDREYYVRAPLEISVLFSRGCTRSIVLQVGFRYLDIQSSGFEADGSLAADPRNAPRTWALPAVVSVRYDTRDSYINPRRGVVALVDIQAAPHLGGMSAEWLRGALWLQGYHDVWTNVILAVRAGVQMIAGSDLPLQHMLSIGGNRTVRGIPQDRFLDRTSAVTNAELRLPLWWRFGCMVGIDAGKVWARPDDMDLTDWAVSPVAGLRFYYDTFVVRLDAGVSRESFGIYFNFGHVF
jgi:outer membrane protein assembly factor BamA